MSSAVSSTISDFQSSFMSYLDHIDVDTQIISCLHTNSPFLPLSLSSILAYSSTLFNKIVNEYTIISFQISRIVNDRVLTKINDVYTTTDESPILNLDVVFTHNPHTHTLRFLKTDRLSKLTTFHTTITRTTPVRPELDIAVFRCLDCQCLTSMKQDGSYTLPLKCSNHLCTNRTKFIIVTAQSTFRDWQKVVSQEVSSEIPGGAIPRTLNLYVRDGLCEMVKPGDDVLCTGVLCVIEESGARGFEDDVREKEFRLGFMVNFLEVLSGNNSDKYVNTENNDDKLSKDIKITKNEVSIADKSNELGTEVPLFTNIYRNLSSLPFPSASSFISFFKSTPNIYSVLSSSLFPNIYGHTSIKNAILLMLAQGNTKSKEGVSIRADINILLVGDPGTAKSQFLKQTSRILGGVYTSGKCSSAAGLTACVVKDIDGDFTIEAGALMLSDGNVCCIDEFDKMNHSDRVAIHEAMEQGTITINKAGINATLNARCSVLAAANPVNGKYDDSKTLKGNVNLGDAIMSRFDVYFCLIDCVDKENDKAIANQILENHTLQDDERSDENDNSINQINSFKNLFTIDEIREYILFVRKNISPKITEESGKLIVKKYLKLRKESLVNSNNYMITVRQLESLIRLSEAMAKIHCDNEVRNEYVEEAYRLVQSSVIEIRSENINIETQANNESQVTNSLNYNKESISLEKKEYLRIMNTFVYILKSKNGLVFEEAINEYLTMREDQIETVEMFKTEEEVAKNVLNYLINKEGVFYLMEDKIFIHPNYDV